MTGKKEWIPHVVRNDGIQEWILKRVQNEIEKGIDSETSSE